MLSYGILKRTIKEKHLTASLLTASPIQEGDLNTLGSRGRVCLSDLARQNAAAEMKRKGTGLSAAEASGAHSGSLKDLHLVAAMLFMYVKHPNHLEMERRPERPEPFNPVPFPTLFFSQDSVQYVWSLGMQDFLPVAFSLLFNTSQSHLFPLLSFGLE